MTRTLDRRDVESARESVIGAMSLPASEHGGGTQALSGVVDVLVLKTLIPIFVSLTSTVLAEITKGKLLPALKRRDAERMLDELLQLRLQPQPEIRDECLDEARRLLAPMGLRDEDIRRLYANVKEKLERPNRR